MKISTQASLLGFLLTLTPVTATATELPDIPQSQSTIAERLNRITTTIREQEAQLEPMPPSDQEALLASGWLNGSRGSFVNANPWRNGWRDGGGFYNYRPGWVNGGFANYRPFSNYRPWVNGGGFLNRY